MSRAERVALTTRETCFALVPARSQRSRTLETMPASRAASVLAPLLSRPRCWRAFAARSVARFSCQALLVSTIFGVVSKRFVARAPPPLLLLPGGPSSSVTFSMGRAEPPPGRRSCSDRGLHCITAAPPPYTNGSPVNGSVVRSCRRRPGLRPRNSTRGRCCSKATIWSSMMSDMQRGVRRATAVVWGSVR